MQQTTSSTPERNGAPDFSAILGSIDPESEKDGLVRLRQIETWDLQESPENEKLYRRVDMDDPAIKDLAKSMKEHGVLEPLVVTEDMYIVSGHRRWNAALLAGLERVPCRVLPIRREDDPNAFVRLLREHNPQRDKTRAEKLREEVVSISPDQAYQDLEEHRLAEATIKVKPMKLGKYRPRKGISPAKMPFLEAIRAIIEARREYWPMSDRQIHYGLLNDPPLRHASKSGSIYDNTKESYKDLTDLLTRARLAGSIPWEAIGDETRPVVLWQVHNETRSFIRGQNKRMFRGYWRNLMQSQPNHIEILGEKNTVGSILRPVAAEFRIPLTTGRGYCSLQPRYELAQRFEESGKEKLVLLICSDFDPDGESIAESFARSMRDDFFIGGVHAIKVALTSTQVKKYKLPPLMKAKESSGQHDKFVKKHGNNVFELEALRPEQLQDILRTAIKSVLDIEAFNAELAEEKKDAAFIASVRKQTTDFLGTLELEEGDQE